MGEGGVKNPEKLPTSFMDGLKVLRNASRILIRNAAEVSYLLKNMADNENKDVEDMMAILAQMEEKAKNMERLVVLRRQVECANPPEKSGTRPKILGVSERCDVSVICMRQFCLFLFLFHFSRKGNKWKRRTR